MIRLPTSVESGACAPKSPANVRDGPGVQPEIPPSQKTGTPG